MVIAGEVLPSDSLISCKVLEGLNFLIVSMKISASRTAIQAIAFPHGWFVIEVSISAFTLLTCSKNMYQASTGRFYLYVNANPTVRLTLHFPYLPCHKPGALLALPKYNVPCFQEVLNFDFCHSSLTCPYLMIVSLEQILPWIHISLCIFKIYLYPWLIYVISSSPLARNLS